MNRLLLSLALAVVFPLAPASAKRQKQTYVPQIVSVKADSITVRTGRNEGYKVTAPDDKGLQKTAPDANIETYKVTQWTKITINAKPAKLSELKRGMDVRVTMGVDRATAAEIAVKVER